MLLTSDIGLEEKEWAKVLMQLHEVGLSQRDLYLYGPDSCAFIPQMLGVEKRNKMEGRREQAHSEPLVLASTQYLSVLECGKLKNKGKRTTINRNNLM